MKLKKISIAVATAIIMSTIGSMPLNTSAVTVSRSYYVYDYETNQTTSTYTLSLTDSNTSAYSIINNDNRVVYAHSGIVQLYLNGGHGTGFVVGDHTIATAAHCLYNHETQQYVTDVRAALYDSDGTPMQIVYPDEGHIPTNYKNLPTVSCYPYDYALLTVSEDLSDYEHFDLGLLPDTASTYEELPVSIVGFAGDLTSECYIGSGYFAGFYQNDMRICYTADTGAGQSGSPIIVASKYRTNSGSWTELKTVIGVHAYGATTTSPTNKGVRFTAEHLQFYKNNPYNTYEE